MHFTSKELRPFLLLRRFSKGRHQIRKWRKHIRSWKVTSRRIWLLTSWMNFRLFWHLRTEAHIRVYLPPTPCASCWKSKAFLFKFSMLFLAIGHSLPRRTKIHFADSSWKSYLARLKITSRMRIPSCYWSTTSSCCRNFTRFTLTISR